MAKKDKGKPSALSEEYIVESSGDENGVIAETQLSPEASPTPLQKSISEKAKKGKTVATPPKDQSSSSESQEEEDEQADVEAKDDVARGASMVNDRAVQVRASSAPSKERPRKKQKPAYVNRLCERWCPDNYRSTSERSVPARPYKPPTGFKPRSITIPDSAARSTQFLTHGLSGKQIWHITAPANASIDSIKTFAIAAIMKGEPIQNSKGTNYSFTAGPSVNKCLLAARSSENDYVPSKIPIHRTYHLREVINHQPVEARDSSNDSSAQKRKTMHFEAQSPEAEDEFALGMPKAKPARQQPKGLRMRYKPFGTPKAPPEDLPAPDDSVAEQSELDVPAQILTPPPEKRGKRQKKWQQTPEPSSSEEDADVMDVDTPTKTLAPHEASSQSRQSIDGLPLKHRDGEEGPVGKEKTKKKSKKHKDREDSSN